MRLCWVCTLSLASQALCSVWRRKVEHERYKMWPRLQSALYQTYKFKKDWNNLSAFSERCRPDRRKCEKRKWREVHSEKIRSSRGYLNRGYPSPLFSMHGRDRSQVCYLTFSSGRYSRGTWGNLKSSIFRQYSEKVSNTLDSRKQFSKVVCRSI